MNRKRSDRINLNEVDSPRIERPETPEQVADRIWDIIHRFREKEPWDLALQICVPIQMIWKGLDWLLEREKIEVVPDQEVPDRDDHCKFCLVKDLP